jgi:hypothetical protein
MQIQERDEIREAKKALFELLGSAAYGTLFTYGTLSDVMRLDSKQYRYAILAVGKQLEREAQRTLACERSIGYRVALPNEHVELGQKQEISGHRKLRRAMQVVNATKKEELSPSEWHRLDAYRTVLLAQRDALMSVQYDLSRVIRRVRRLNTETQDL